MNRELALRFNDEGMGDQIKEIKKLQEQIRSLDDLILNWGVKDVDAIANILIGEMEDGSAVYTIQWEDETEMRSLIEIGVKCAIAAGIAGVSINELVIDAVNRARELHEETDEVVKNETERMGDTESGD